MTQDTQDYATYIEKYPVPETGQVKGKYTERAYIILAKLKQRLAAFEEYLDKFQQDKYREEALTVKPPKGPASGIYRVLPGGSWAYAPDIIDYSDRNSEAPKMLNYYTGFRIARSVK